MSPVLWYKWKIIKNISNWRLSNVVYEVLKMWLCSLTLTSNNDCGCDSCLSWCGSETARRFYTNGFWWKIIWVLKWKMNHTRLIESYWETRIHSQTLLAAVNSSEETAASERFSSSVCARFMEEVISTETWTGLEGLFPTTDLTLPDFPSPRPPLQHRHRFYCFNTWDHCCFSSLRKSSGSGWGALSRCTLIFSPPECWN